jgi:mono/diheme cytochrome c family protein
MSNRRLPAAASSCLLLAILALSARAAEETVSYNTHIRPILADNCFSCHGVDAQNRKAKLRLDTLADATTERRGVRALVPRDLANSELWQRIISTDADEMMPPPDSHKAPLTPAQRALIKRWIEQGAVYQNHWAFEPIALPALPAAVSQLSVLGSQPSAHPVDRFIAARGEGLAAHIGAKAQIIRRCFRRMDQQAQTHLPRTWRCTQNTPGT